MSYNYPKAIERYSRMKDDAIRNMYHHKLVNEPIYEDLETIQFADIMLKMIRNKRRQDNRRNRLKRKQQNENL